MALQSKRSYLHKLIIAVAFFALAELGVGVIQPRDSYYEKFLIGNKVKSQVLFWEAIFKKYPSTMAVIHDIYSPQYIIDIIDYEVFAKKYNKGRMFNLREKRFIVSKYVKRYEQAIKRFRRERKRALRYGPMEERIYNVYKKDPKMLSKLYTGKVAIRVQDGLADVFAEAALRARNYLPYMEKIFLQYRLPKDLTRIVFVESMFNSKIRSKVGASGMWQFMPRTARLYMRVNSFIDERNSPIKATKAAASLLRDNYSKLKSWPLAITAYNHGAAGMLRAVRRLKTKNLSTIIKKYKSRTFGFASRNFYSEFIAARNIFQRYYAKKIKKDSNPLKISSIRLQKPVSVYQLIRYTPLDRKILQKYNGCLTRKAFNSHKYRNLPKNYELIVPIHLANAVGKSIYKIR